MKTISLEQSVALIPDGASLMIGGFMAVGTPERVVDEIVRQKKRDLTVIANDTAMPGKGIGKLVVGQASAQGHRQPHRSQPGNAEADDGRRARGGAGAARNADRAHPRRRAWTRRHPDADRHRDVRSRTASSSIRSTARATCSRSRCAPTSRWCRRFSPTTSAISSYALTARNFNPVIAMAADTVIVCADNVVPVGVISPDHVVTPAPTGRLSGRRTGDANGTAGQSSPVASRASSNRACSSISASAFRRWSRTICRRECTSSSSPRTD